VRFAQPQFFWALLVVLPALSGFLWWAWRKRQELITQFVSARLLSVLKVGVSPARQKLRLVLMVVAVAFLILALARPQWGFSLEEAKQQGLDIVVAIDTSKSMLAEDVAPNRLARAKLAAMDLMRLAKSDRLGLVAFAGTAFLQCPLTLDDAAFSQSVDSLDTATISQGGTALAEAIQTAKTAFKDAGDNHKVLVLFTDGEDHDGEAVPAAQDAAKAGMRIFTVGIGSPEGELLRVKDEKGRVGYIQDEQGNPVKSHLNEELLRQIADAANGFYLPLRGTKTMDTLYERGLAPLPKSDVSSRLLRQYHERFQWPLAVAIILLLLEMFLPERKRRRSAKGEAISGAAPVPAGIGELAAILLLLALPVNAWSGASDALREYEAGKYQDALKEYQKLLDRKSADPRLHFNTGAAAYQSKQLEEAAKRFNEALASPDLELQQRAYYNLGNTLYRLGEKISEPEKRQQAWENSIKQYESALKLNQQDPDAKFNHEFVKQQLEELKKQQSQSQSQKNSDKNKQDKNQQQQQQQQNQSKDDSKKDQDQKSQSQKQREQSQQNRDSQAQNQPQAQSDKEKQDASQSQQKQGQTGEKKDAAQSQSSGKPNDKSQEQAEQEAAMMAAGQMTPQQAQQLLDAEKANEEVLRLAPMEKRNGQGRPFKDW
jgi:Ca-activated chloride channel family protein